MRFPGASRAGDDHQAAVARRLALLSAELAAVRDSVEAPDSPPRSWVPDGTPPRPGPTDDDGRQDASAPPALPRPGRHAERDWPRVLGVFRQRPTGELTLGPAQIGVLVAAVVLATLVAVWQSVRARPEAVAGGNAASTPAALVAPDAVGGSGAVDPAAGAASRSAPSSTAVPPLVVDVSGRVRRPGIAVLPPGSRVVDALEAAGGARRSADLSSLNLARPLVDGEQVVVGIPPPTGAAGAAVPSGSPGSVPGGEPVALVNLNQADQAALETLPGVGPVTAQAILAWREDQGGFSAVEELLEVDGIGEATLAQLVPHVTV